MPRRLRLKYLFTAQPCAVNVVFPIFVPKKLDLVPLTDVGSGLAPECTHVKSSRAKSHLNLFSLKGLIGWAVCMGANKIFACSSCVYEMAKSSEAPVKNCT